MNSLKSIFRKKGENKPDPQASDEKSNEEIHNEEIKEEKNKEETRETNEEYNDDDETVEQAPDNQGDVQESLNDDAILGIMIECIDRLKTRMQLLKPYIRMHIVDGDTGAYLRRTRSNDSTDTFTAIDTPVSDYRQQGLSRPHWNKLINTNEAVNYLCRAEIKPMLFFELIDIRSNDNGSKQLQHIRVAWAFLKLHSDLFTITARKRQQTTNRNLLLQLFRIPDSLIVINDNRASAIYDQWKNRPRVKINGVSLHIQLRKMLSRKSVNLMRQKYIENKTDTAEENPTEETQDSLKREGETTMTSQPVIIWSRLPNQPYKIPNHRMGRLQPTPNGCFRLKFSHSGLLLATATSSTDSKHPIIIYDIPSCQKRMTLEGHTRLVHDMNWTTVNEYLISCSADASVRIWHMQETDDNQLHILPHPVPVYCCIELPNQTDENKENKEKDKNKNILPYLRVLTGARDGLLRIWNVYENKQAGKLICEIFAHQASINSLAISNERIYSSDALGRIIVWTDVDIVSQYDKYISKLEKGDFDEQSGVKSLGKTSIKFVKEITSDELREKCINQIFMIDQRTMLVFARNTSIKLLDVRTGIIGRRIILNYECTSAQIVISPCGKFLFVPSKYNVDVYSIDQGKYLAELLKENFLVPAICVTYHPHEHMCAIGNLAPSQNGVTLLDFDVNLPEIESSQSKKQFDDKSYLDISVEKLLAGHKLLTKIDAIEKAGLQRQEKERNLEHARKQLKTEAKSEDQQIIESKHKIKEPKRFEESPDILLSDD